MDFQRSLFKIQGNKFKLLPHIKSVYDKMKCELWVEPFMGSGTVGFNLAECPAHFYDINPYVIEFYRMLKSGDITPKDLQLKLRMEKAAFAKDGSDYYYRKRQDFVNKPDALEFFILNRVSYNGLMRFGQRKKNFNTPYCKNDEKITDSLIEFIFSRSQDIVKRIHKWDWTFDTTDFRTVIESHKGVKGSVLFLDPPYIERNPTYFTPWTESDEEALFTSVKDSGLPFMLTTWIEDKRNGSFNPMFKKLWKDEYDYKENSHTYIINGTKKDIDKVNVREAVSFFIPEE